VHKYIELARRTKFSRQPFQFGLNCRRLRIVQESSEQGRA
jgi:hypothetical protein